MQVKKQWTITDIKEIEPQLTDEQCHEVLQLGADYNEHVGANWYYWGGLVEDYLDTNALLEFSEPKDAELYPCSGSTFDEVRWDRLHKLQALSVLLEKEDECLHLDLEY
jgi:hypothetical protein